MIAKHRWGTPIDEENLLAVAAIAGDDYPAARAVVRELQGEPYVTNVGKRGIKLESSAFGALADVLYDDCGWEPFQIRSRLEHYEGWDRHEWA